MSALANQAFQEGQGPYYRFLKGPRLFRADGSAPRWWRLITMGLVSWCRSLFSSPLQRALSTLPVIDSDDVPEPEHQRCVHDLAVECLTYLADLGEYDGKWNKMQEALDSHPLLGLEVTDEALVLYKNETGTWGQLRGDALMILHMLYGSYSKQVAGLRGGRNRGTTTPTLKGGGRRQK